MNRLLFIIGIPIFSLIFCNPVSAQIHSFSTEGHTVYHLKPATVTKDGSRAILTAAYDGTILCHKQDGTFLWKYKPSEGFPFSLAAGDIDNDGLDEVFSASSDGNLYAIDHNGILLWTFESHPPLYAVDVTYAENGSPVILTGGIEKKLYALASDGATISSFNTNGVIRLIGTEKILNDDKNYAAVAAASAGLVGNFNLSLHAIPNLEMLWEKPTGSNDSRSNNFGRNFSIDFADLDKNGTQEMIFGLFYPQSDEVSVFDSKGNKKIIKTCENARIIPYKMNLVTHISSATLGDEYFINLSGSDLIIFDNDGNCRDMLVGKYAFAGSAFDPETDTYWLGSGISGGDGIYRIDLHDKDWKKEFVNLQPVGKMAQLEKNMKTLLKQVESFNPPAYQPVTSSVLLTTEEQPSEIKTRYIEPYDIKNLRFASYKKFTVNYDPDHIIPELTPVFKREWERLHRNADNTREEILAYAMEREKNSENFFIFAGHGRKFGIDFYAEPETYYELLRIAPNTLEGFVFAELEIYDEHAARAIRDLLLPLADSCYEHGKKKIFLRNKNIFWNGSIYLDLFKPIYSKEKYREIFIPSMEETNSRNQSLSLAGRTGIWMTGMFNHMSGRAVTDNANYNRLWEWGQTQHLSHFIRKLSLNRMLGADMFQINVYTDNEDEMLPFYLMLEKGVLPEVEPEDLISVSGLTIGMKDPHPDFLKHGKNGHNMDGYSENEGEFVFDRLDCYWGGAPLADHDFERYAMNARRRLTNFIAQSPYGNVTMISSETDISEFPQLSEMIVTDGKYWYDEKGQKFSASEYRPVVLEALERHAKDLPLRIYGEVAWSAVKLDEEHVRLVLIDPGYLDPADRQVKIEFQYLQPRWIKDILSGESIPLVNGEAKLEVPLGILRILDIKIDTGKKPGSVPPMGWNSWNWFGKHEVNEVIIMECMDAMVEKGLLDAGYEYFVIDGGWRDTKLSPCGKLLSHPKKFPNGIKPLADYAHTLGFKFGLHTVPGTHDCGGDTVGGYGIEEIHMKQFEDWGIDFIKLDKCIHEDGWNEEKLKKAYFKWHKLIQESEREILFSISAHHPRNDWYEWFTEISEIARTTGDIKARVSGGAAFDSVYQRSVMMIADENNRWASYAGNGYWNDPDFLAVGNQGLTIEEQKVHFALWCIMTSPLILGNDPRNMSDEELEILTNKRAIEINQDPSEQGKRIIKDKYREVWIKNLSDGNKAVLLLNRDGLNSRKLSISLKDLDVSSGSQIFDIYKGRVVTPLSGIISQELGPHDGLFFYIKTF